MVLTSTFYLLVKAVLERGTLSKAEEKRLLEQADATNIDAEAWLILRQAFLFGHIRRVGNAITSIWLVFLLGSNPILDTKLKSRVLRQNCMEVVVSICPVRK